MDEAEKISRRAQSTSILANGRDSVAVEIRVMGVLVYRDELTKSRCVA